jgi:hypothetical protein
MSLTTATQKEFCNAHRHPTSYMTLYGSDCLPCGSAPNAWTSKTDTKLL